jgi:hypothetical protein
MARQEGPREDLMREAVALVRRIELQLEAEHEPVIIGFRRDGSASIFFGEDPVVHFNSAHELRRGYRAGRLIKAEQGRLVSLTRQRTDRETQLLRHELTRQEAADYVDEIQTRMDTLRDALHKRRFRILRQAPESEDLLTEVHQWIESLGTPLPIARSPRVG